MLRLAASTPLAAAALLIAASAVAPGPTALAAPQGVPAAVAPPPPLDPAVASCLLSELGRARTETSAGLLLEACEALAGPGAEGPGPDPSFLVECRVAREPEWARVRLLTRRQCAAAGGRTAAD